MLVSMMRSAAVAVETTGPSFGAGLRCNSIALLHLTNGHGPGSRGVDGGDPIEGVRHSACHPRQRLRRGQVPAGTTVRAAGFRWSRKELTHGSCQKDDTFSQNSGAQEHQTRRTEALVATRDEGEGGARPQTGVFKLTSAKKFATSLQRSAEHSARRKTGAYRSAL